MSDKEESSGINKGDVEEGEEDKVVHEEEEDDVE